MGQYKSPYTGSPATHSHRPVCHQPPSSHHYNLRNHTPPPSYPIFWPERDRILTEDNLISVRERREAKHWHRTCNTSTDGESHDLWKKSYGLYACVHVYVQEVSDWLGQWTTKHSIVCSTGFHVNRVDQLTARTILCVRVQGSYMCCSKRAAVKLTLLHFN